MIVKRSARPLQGHREPFGGSQELEKQESNREAGHPFDPLDWLRGGSSRWEWLRWSFSAYLGRGLGSTQWLEIRSIHR